MPTPPNSPTAAAPRSDAAMLHVDFEHYEDDLVGLLNAGVRWVGDPFATNIRQHIVTVANDASLAFAGRRCAHVHTCDESQVGRIVLQMRHDAPRVNDVVAEFVYRPVSSDGVNLIDFTVWSAMDRQGVPVMVRILACGSAAEGRYRLDVVHHEDELRRTVAENLPQDRWIRVILERASGEGTVHLWLGEPGQERWVGACEDLNRGGAVHRIELGDLIEGVGQGSGYWDDVRVGGRLAVGGEPRAGETVQRIEAPGPAASPCIVTRERQLFVDDRIVQTAESVTRTMHPAIKHGANPLLIPDEPWEIECGCILPLSVLRDADTGRFRCWYGVWGKHARRPTYEAIADSDDGLVWTKPRLGLHKLPSGLDNNIIREGRMFRVLHDPRDPDPGRRYKAIIRDAGFLAAFSPDGLTWRTDLPVLDQAYDASSVHWDPAGEKWIASCKIWKRQRARGYAESRDFLDWTDTRFMLAADEHDRPADQTYSLSIVRYESVYVGFLKIYHTDTDRCDVQVLFSRDAKNWDRPFRQPLIANGERTTDWDHGNIDPPEQIHVVGNVLRMYYAGRRTLHNQFPNDGAGGLALLRRDGFVSMDGGSAPGVLVTKPLILKGKNLFLNADASTGRIETEILEARTGETFVDEADVPIYPFTRDHAEPVTTDSTAHRVAWRNAADLRALRGRPIRLRFTLTGARLYSFWTQP